MSVLNKLSLALIVLMLGTAGVLWLGMSGL